MKSASFQRNVRSKVESPLRYEPSRESDTEPEDTHETSQQEPFNRNRTVISAYNGNRLIVVLIKIVVGFGCAVHTICRHIFLEKCGFTLR